MEKEIKGRQKLKVSGMEKRERKRQKEGLEVERPTLKSLRASVCRASEGRVVRGERRPSLQKLKASPFHKADSGKRKTGEHINPCKHTHARTGKHRD